MATIVQGYYASVADTVTFAQQIGQPFFEGLSDDVQNQARDQALLDIVEITREQPTSVEAPTGTFTQTPWLEDDGTMIEVFMRQSIYVAKHLDNRAAADSMRNIASSTFSDGVLDLSEPAAYRFEPQAYRMLNQRYLFAIQQNAVQINGDIDQNQQGTFARG